MLLSSQTTFGPYRIERTLGEGGMGIVYLATEVGLGRQVALKVIRAELAGDEGFRARFRSESRTAASVEHPNVVTVFRAGELDGLLYVAMRYVPGRDLGRAISAEGPLPPGSAADLIAQVGDGLDAVHAAGLVHRDVKPANVILGEEDDAHLTDFGLAKAMASSSGLTETGQVIGTADYMAPEQIEGRRVDARTDVYALGGVLYWAITGKVPYPEREGSAKLWAHVHEPPPPVPAGGARLLDPVIRRAMAKDPAERFPSAGDLGRAAVAAARSEAITEPEHVVASGDAAPLPETVPLSPPGRMRPGRLIALVCAALAIAAIGAVAVVEAPKLTERNGSSSSPPYSAPSGIAVPDLAGTPLDQAEARLDDLGLHSSEQGGGLFGVVVPSDWNVCGTTPGAGTTVPRGTTIELAIDRPGAC